MPRMGFAYSERKIGFVQDGAVAANGQDHVSALQALLQRQINERPCRAVFLQSIVHQHMGAVVEQNLRRTQRNARGQTVLPGLGEM